MNNLRSVLVTGASKGIGKEIAIQLSKLGFFVVAHYKSDFEGVSTTKKIINNSGSECEIIKFDISDRNECRKKLEAFISANGPFYGIVTNAGIFKDVAFPAMSDSDWDSVIHTNLDGFYNVVRPCVMGMISKRRGGRIIAISSVSGITGNRGQVNYSASKAGLIGAVKSLAVELAKREITVNCVAPGLIDTGAVSEEVYDHAKSMIPMQRMGRASEVAGVVSFLMSEESSYITRQVISVNGGMV